ncbi:hypothetical protein Tcan_17790 [Toxocara canis]|uniref:Uncharacterized protein n=1 Tax=Toxocara canis TaxID=6265 RepID=A0A0B2UP79_TOXCA|nr:hypothetical protein Tcan_17790 [Toxocara canis]
MEKMSGSVQPETVQRSSEPLIVGQLPREDEKMPLFLIKLWNIVEDAAYQNVIRWDEPGPCMEPFSR